MKIHILKPNVRWILQFGPVKSVLSLTVTTDAQYACELNYMDVSGVVSNPFFKYIFLAINRYVLEYLFSILEGRGLVGALT